LIMKLEATGERFHWRIAADQPQRGHQIFEVLPQLAESVAYDRTFTGATVLRHNLQATPGMNSWAALKAHQEIFLTINNWFDPGKGVKSVTPAGHINDFLPDLPTNFFPQYQTQKYAAEAEALLPKTSKYLMCYGSSYSSARYWHAWQDDQWFVFINKMRGRNPKIVPVLTGASWDTNMLDKLKARLTGAYIPFAEIIGKPLGLVIEVMKRVNYGVYFPSGLSIIAGTLGVPCTMWYPPHLESMAGKWSSPQVKNIFSETKMITPEEQANLIWSKGILE